MKTNWDFMKKCQNKRLLAHLICCACGEFGDKECFENALEWLDGQYIEEDIEEIANRGICYEMKWGLKDESSKNMDTERLYNDLMNRFSSLNIVEMYVMPDGIIRFVNTHEGKQDVNYNLSAEQVKKFVSYFMEKHFCGMEFKDEFSVKAKIPIGTEFTKVKFSADIPKNFTFPKFDIKKI